MSRHTFSKLSISQSVLRQHRTCSCYESCYTSMKPSGFVKSRVWHLAGLIQHVSVLYANQSGGDLYRTFLFYISQQVYLTMMFLFCNCSTLCLLWLYILDNNVPWHVCSTNIECSRHICNLKLLLGLWHSRKWAATYTAHCNVYRWNPVQILFRLPWACFVLN